MSGLSMPYHDSNVDIRRRNTLRKTIHRQMPLIIIVLTIVLAIGLWVKTAWASEPKTKTKQAAAIEKRTRPERSDWVSQTTTTTTTTTRPPRKVKAVQPTAPAPVIASYEQGSIQQMIVDSANRHGLDPQRMLRIAKCESGFNPGSVAGNLIDGAHPTGLYQHVAKYWPARAAKYGFSGASIFDANAQIEVTMGMFVDGASGAWACK